MTAASFEIRELEGPERILTLRERALPHRGLKFEGEHRIAETEYAGSPNTGQQALGAKELPTVISGEWNDRFIADRNAFNLPMASVASSQFEMIDGYEALVVQDNAIVNVAELARLVDDMRRSGMPVRVSWAHLARIGRIKRFAHTWLTENDCEWEIEFAWIGQEELERGLETPATPDTAKTARVLDARVGDVTDALRFDAVDELDPGFVAEVDRTIAEIQAQILAVDDAVRSAVDGIAAPIETTRRALATLSLLRDQASDLVDSIEGRVAGSITVVDDLTELGNVPHAVAVAITCGQRRAARAARAIRHEIAVRRHRIERTVENDVIAIVMAREGDDLRGYARRYYGNAGDWDAIRRFNGLSSSLLEEGTIVLIPARGSQ